MTWNSNVYNNNITNVLRNCFEYFFKIKYSLFEGVHQDHILGTQKWHNQIFQYQLPTVPQNKFSFRSRF